MYTILINEDNTLTASVVERVMQQSKLVDTLHFLADPEYKGKDMHDYVVMLEYRLPVSKKYRTEFLTLSDELYKNKLEYKLPFDTALTSEAGVIEFQLTFGNIEMDAEGRTTQYIRKVGPGEIKIVDVYDWAATIPDEALNGKLEYTNSGVSNSSSFAYATALIHDSQYHYLADVRIYDNTLSPKEVHEISLGLCCHYPLNDPYATGSINKYSGDNFEGKPSGSSYTVTKLANERGYNYKLSYTGTGNNTWPNFYFPTFSFTAGKTYDYSCKVRCHSKNFNISFRAAHISNDWVTSMKTITVADNQWHEYHIQIKLDAKYTRSGTEYDTKPLVEFYSESLATKDKVYTCDFDLKDVCVSECSTAASGSNGSWADNTVYDTSGFGNHGKSNSSEFISCTKDTPRYQASYYFANSGTPNISMPNFAFEDMTCGTVNLWINRYSATSTWRNYLSFADGYNWTGNKADFIILGTTGNPGLSMDCCSNVVTVDYGLKKWNMYTIAWDLVTHTAKYFVNGELIKTITNDRIGTEYAKAHGQIFIGNAWYTESDYALSDFRMYATALSDADVAALYNTPVSITSNGTMMTKGELIET